MLLEHSLFAQPRFAKNPKLSTRKLLRNHRARLQSRGATGRPRPRFLATLRLHSKAVQRWNVSPGHRACERKPGER